MFSLTTVFTCCFFFLNDTATTEIYTLSLHDALPIFTGTIAWARSGPGCAPAIDFREDRKSTRLNSSHVEISYAVFCLKKKNEYDELFSNMIEKLHLAHTRRK